MMPKSAISSPRRRLRSRGASVTWISSSTRSRLLGESHVAAGRVGEGMKLLDQAMTAVSAGEVVGVVPVGDIYCRLLSACETARDVARAEEWMAVAGSFGAWSDFVSPVCRTHYGGILVAIGRWSEAEEQLLAALRTLSSGYRGISGWPLGKLADLRVRQGRYRRGAPHDRGPRIAPRRAASPRGGRAWAGRGRRWRRSW